MSGGFQIVEIDLASPSSPAEVDDEFDGVACVARWRGRVVDFAMFGRHEIDAAGKDGLRKLADDAFGLSLLKARIRDSLLRDRPTPKPLPGVTVAICTKDRSDRLSRLLDSLDALDPAPTDAPAIDVLVIDNAPSDTRTRDAVAGRPNVRYALEDKQGLDFARNAALANARGDILAFLDDDVTVDPDWLKGLYRAWASCPDAGGFAGMVLPFSLSTQSQQLFELNGGFGNGFERKMHAQEKMGSPLFPSGIGVVGAGCNMAFDRALLDEIGGFDNALDTGRPLPGGGDLDIFYRVIRANRPMIYEPSYVVYHEHRQSMPELKHQYWTWGLGFMAFLAKCRVSDPTMRRQNRAMVRIWFFRKFLTVLRAARGKSTLPASHELAELLGGIVGRFGEYGRSRRRIGRIERAHR